MNTNAFAMQRPGGRSAANTAAIRAAVMSLLLEEGIGEVTYQRVSERAGVARSTLYRRFDDRWDLILDALIENAAALVAPRDRGSFREDLSDLLLRLAKGLQGPMGPVVMSVLSAVSASAAGTMSPAYVVGRLEQVAPMFDRAVARGELRPDADRATIFSVASGAIWYHHFVAAQAVDEAFVDEITDLICDRFADCA